ncbi:MAG: acetyl-CoA carboxylase carboxyltransferase subunit alpha [Erysipelothrix sp.]|nr:acetyl-CoA carboxylase carboxyltransferase subunit alpha [Erysipelothrix sp.]
MHQILNNTPAWDRVVVARHPSRPKAIDFLPLLFDGLILMRGDRLYGDDPALIGGIAYFNNRPVTVLAQSKGRNAQENVNTNFGMMHPEGYRKAMRLAKQAEKFERPIITLIDTPGAYPGVQAEQRGQATAIAQCLQLFASLQVPVIALVISEGGSGGALALSVADAIIMLENAIYSVLSPEGFASILWKDESKAPFASEIIKLTSADLLELKIADTIIEESEVGSHMDLHKVADQCKSVIQSYLDTFSVMPVDQLLQHRYQKFRKIGTIE